MSTSLVRELIALAVFCFLLTFGLLMNQMQLVPELVVDGRNLSQWTSELHSGDNDREKRAVAALVKMLNRTNDPGKLHAVLCTLGNQSAKASSALPTIRRLKMNESQLVRDTSGVVESMIERNTKPINEDFGGD